MSCSCLVDYIRLIRPLGPIFHTSFLKGSTIQASKALHMVGFEKIVIRQFFCVTKRLRFIKLSANIYKIIRFNEKNVLKIFFNRRASESRPCKFRYLFILSEGLVLLNLASTVFSLINTSPCYVKVQYNNQTV